MSLANIVSRGNFLRLKLETSTASEAERAEYYALPVVIGDPNCPSKCAVVPRAPESVAAWFDAAQRLSRREESVIVIDSGERDASNADGPDFTIHADPATGDVVTLAKPGFDPPNAPPRPIVGRTLSRGG